MGITYQSTGLNMLKEMFQVKVNSREDIVIALAGNPNTGKSTVFNSLTGLKQHTGNWPGKTVTNAQGNFTHRDKTFVLVDLPGAYSLLANSVEEEVARDFICFGQPKATVVVVDSTCLERNLNLVLQILEITSNVVVCVNLLDEAKRKKIHLDLALLSQLLGVPVIGTIARDGIGLQELKNAIYNVTEEGCGRKPITLFYDEVIEQALQLLEPRIKEIVKDRIRSRWVALRLLEADRAALAAINQYLNINLMQDHRLRTQIAAAKKILTDYNINPDRIRDRIVCSIVSLAERLHNEAVQYENNRRHALDNKIDNIVTSRALGIPVMLILLGMVFWITLMGANYPSDILASFFNLIEERLTIYFSASQAPVWVHGLLVLGMYRTLAWVVSVMLPPMAIFFPLFTLLEDLGYLPRVAFNLDHFFKKACAHGKQALTMCMGFGCNAAGVIACRIIDSPRERLIATITNNFVPCNGRFPTLIALATIFLARNMGPLKSIGAALMILGMVVLGVIVTVVVSKILSTSILKGQPSSFTLELPPYRKPRIGRVIIRSIFDRTLFVLARAVYVAAPAGILIWLMANISIGDASILNHCAQFLNPFGRMLGMDGFILMAFILGLPANEIVIPILIMGYMSRGAILELNSLEALRELFVNNGWTWLTAVCTMLFSLNHYPCGTTLLTIQKETQSLKWTLVSFLAPTITGLILCFTVAQTCRLLGLG